MKVLPLLEALVPNAPPLPAAVLLADAPPPLLAALLPADVPPPLPAVLPPLPAALLADVPPPLPVVSIDELPPLPVVSIDGSPPLPAALLAVEPLLIPAVDPALGEQPKSRRLVATTAPVRVACCVMSNVLPKHKPECRGLQIAEHDPRTTFHEKARWASKTPAP